MLSFFIVTLIAAAMADPVPHDGACPEVKPVENFNLTAVSTYLYFFNM